MIGKPRSGSSSRTAEMAAKVRFVESPEGQALPFIAGRLHSERGQKVAQRMLFPSADMLAAAIAAIPAGRSADLAAVRGALAVEHGAATTCPVTSQRLLRDIAVDAVAGWEAGRRDGPRSGGWSIPTGRQRGCSPAARHSSGRGGPTKRSSRRTPGAAPTRKSRPCGRAPRPVAPRRRRAESRCRQGSAGAR